MDTTIREFRKTIAYTYQVCARRDRKHSIFSSFVIPSENMVLIPAGSLAMGDAMNETEKWMNEANPAVVLNSFYMNMKEVKSL